MRNHFARLALVIFFCNVLPFSVVSIEAAPSTPSLPDTPTSKEASLGGPESVANSRYQPIVGTRGMVVSDDRQASEWGAEILRRGGNAIDAAVATAFALSVTRPHYASIGGGGFMLYCPHPDKNGAVPCQALDYRERAPAKASRDMYLRDGKADTQLSQDGALASGVPGVTAGLLLALEKYGTMPRSKLLSRPIEIARKGYLFSTHSEDAAAERWSAMNDEAKRIFGCGPKNESKNNLPGIPKKACAPGELIKQPDLANVLGEISRLGKKAFYEGPVAKKIVDGLKGQGGIITLKDLADYRPRMRTPLRGTFEGHEIISMPPPSSGGAIVIQLLGYAERADQAGAFKDGYGSVAAIHAIIHGMSHAFADRAFYFGDPDFIKFPLETLISPKYLDEQWKTFEPGQAALAKGAGKATVNEPQHTTHFSVMDREGNTVAITTTVNNNFGSGFVPPGTGIVMNDEMDDFSTQIGVPNLFGLVGNESNSIAPEKRPLSSMSPTIVRDLKGNNQIAIGAAGGPRIITAVFLSLLNRLRFGMTLSDAVAMPRVHHQWSPSTVYLEKNGFSHETRSMLEDKGYALGEAITLGKVHALERTSNGRTWGAADPRGEGAAVPE
jgi:gamma-glutamyltranspeptidase/glutathione hydrolase